MKNLQRQWYPTSMLCLILLGYLSVSQAQSPSPLEVDQHPTSPEYESLFSDELLPLDTELSWKKRFSGNESFSAEETLPPTSPALKRQLVGAEMGSNDRRTDAFDASGVVKQVKAAEGKLKIEHGPIDRLGMPAMTMLFRVDESTLLAGIEKGAQIRFDVENTSAGFTVTRIESGVTGFDASGVVQQVRLSEGKLKVEHGPIERLGMPAMTMLFRVENPDQLADLDKGSEIEFDVDNTAAGFAIVRLRQIDTNAGRPFDASGTIKTIRVAQGKVKIEHGPIERLGMPAMTMLFKLQRPQDVNALKVGMPIEFDVHNGSAGFEITRFRLIGADSEAGGNE